MVELVAVEGHDRWARLKQTWAEAVERKRTVASADASAAQVAIDAWLPDERTEPVAWVQARIASGDDAGRWIACYGEGWWFDALLDVDDDPRAALIDTVWLEHQEFTAEQIRRLARRAPQIVELKLEEIDEDEQQLAGLFPGGAPWSRLRLLRIDSSEHNQALMPGLAMTHLPALRQLKISQHWDAYKLAGASWLSTLATLHVTGGSRNPAWLSEQVMPSLVELGFELHPDAITESVQSLVDRTRKPKLARLVLHGLASDVPLPSIAGVEIIRG